MYVIREVFHCKPGKVRALVEKFQAMSKMMVKHGDRPMRILTDTAGERYWTLVAEMEVDSLAAFETMMATPTGGNDDSKEFEKIMAGYHDLIVDGRREIYKVES